VKVLEESGQCAMSVADRNSTPTQVSEECSNSHQGSPHFFAVPRNKRIKSAENLSEKKRNEPIKRAQAGGVWEKVEYRLDE